MKNSPAISGSGANEFRSGFSKENLDNHWKKHFEEYKGYTKEQYAQGALDLVQTATSETILGYKNARGQVVRYDMESGNFVKGHPEIGISTMYRPKNGIEHFYNKAAEEAVED